jgi:tRNA A-37 threonylcarbamoyl transferase component Bud32
MAMIGGTVHVMARHSAYGRPASPVPGLSDLRIMATGGFSTVFRARQDAVLREVALKIDNRVLSTDRDRRRFLREAASAGRVSDHPSVVDLYDAGVTVDGHPYLVMELCTGGSYADRLKRQGRLDAGEVCAVGIAIAGALDAAHRSGVLHRDVKPGNILIDRLGRPRLADFGLAAALNPDGEMSVTVDALTPAFASPEALCLEPPTEQGDVYSLAATLYTLAAGRPPWWDGRTVGLRQVLERRATPLPRPTDMPPALHAVLSRGLAPHAEDRPATAAEFRDDLANAAADPGRGHLLLAPAGRHARRGAVAPAAAGRRGPMSWSSRRRRYAATGTAAVVALGLAVAIGSAAPDEPAGGPVAAGRAGGSVAPGGGIAGGPGLTPGLLCAAIVRQAPDTSLEARCMPQPECWNDVTVIAAVPVSCDVRHDFETYVVGTLRVDTNPYTARTVRADRRVTALCDTALLTVGLAAANVPDAGWRVGVLGPREPDRPTVEQRAFRCVVGRPGGAVGSLAFR